MPIYKLKVINCRIAEVERTGFSIPKTAVGVTIVVLEHSFEYEIRYLMPVLDGTSIEGDIKAARD